MARISHRPALPDKLQLAAIKIRETLSAKPFDPPARKEIALDGSAQQVLQFLIENGEVIEINTDVVLLRENFERMKSAVVDSISKNGPATVSDLRKALKSSRRTRPRTLHDHASRTSPVKRMPRRSTVPTISRASIQ